MLRREFLDGKMTERQAINADAKLLDSAHFHILEACFEICEYKTYCDLVRNTCIDRLLWTLLRELHVIGGGLVVAQRVYKNKRKPTISYEVVHKSFSPLAQKECERMMDMVSAMVKERESRKGGAE